MKIIEFGTENVPVTTMKDGDIAQIVTWGHNVYVGDIVQRSGPFLFAIGKKAEYWDDFPFVDLKQSKTYDGCTVKILPKGTRLEI